MLERGDSVENRQAAVAKFRLTRVLDTESNIQFGEGGAGTFSDGKLNTGTHDPRGKRVLHALAAAGAPEEILWQAKPHIGTDKLPATVRGLREKIIALGGEVRFESQVTGIRTEDGRVTGLEINGSEILPCDRVVLALGTRPAAPYSEEALRATFP